MTTAFLPRRFRLLMPLIAAVFLLSVGGNAPAQTDDGDLPTLGDRLPRIDIRFETSL